MNKSKRQSWWGLYALIPTIVGLLYGAAMVRVGEVVHRVLLLALLVLVTILASVWSQRNAVLMATQGVNAFAEEDRLSAAGTTAGRLAAPRAITQADYRSIMLAGAIDQSHDSPTGADQRM